MGLFWLSFADPKRPAGEQFLGVALVEADDMTEALRVAWRTRCNPGGEVNGYELPLDDLANDHRVLLARTPHHVLLSRPQLETLGLVTVDDVP